MKAVFAGAQLAHAPTRFLSLGRLVAYPDPPERARQLLEGARTAGARVCAARSVGPDHFLRIHTKSYLQFLQTAFADWQALPGSGPELRPSLRPLGRHVNTPTHVLGRAGFHLMDFACPLTADTWRAASASAMTAITAADLVLKGEAAAYAVCRPPGHHAYAKRAGGCCYLNNAALAAEQLRLKHKQVAVLDLDVHHGNGTQDIFYARDDVLTLSIHADPDQFYPFYWGYAEETGKAGGDGFNLNIPLPVKSGDALWLEALEQALARLKEYAPGALVVALGLDAHEQDPVQGGAVTTAGFERLGGRLGRLNLPTVIVQEGGSLTPHLGDNLAMFLSGFEGTMQAATDIAAA